MISRYYVRYQYGTYSGTRVVPANTEDEAIAKVRTWVHNNNSLVMAYESYQVIKVAYARTEDEES